MGHKEWVRVGVGLNLLYVFWRIVVRSMFESFFWLVYYKEVRVIKTEFPSCFRFFFS